MLRLVPFLLLLALTIYAFVDCLNTPEEEVKALPKGVWVIIILLFSIVGPLVWLFAGKKRSAVGGAGGGRSRRNQWVAPDDNPDFLKSLSAEQEKKDEAQQAKEAEEAAGEADGEARGKDEGGDREPDGDRDRDRDRDKDKD
ncbi:PLD nuclease N-terminal domain-containing protein [Streptomyces sp. NPDC001568]|uniref:PLD nuclease N-terminal domain-containing protein n=1 Tax=Streptomyces sp. NPDC001568 TaxID=3364588 RepID=UPI0036BF7682